MLPLIFGSQALACLLGSEPCQLTLSCRIAGTSSQVFNLRRPPLTLLAFVLCIIIQPSPAQCQAKVWLLFAAESPL
jgi:hypothetical protein